MKYIKRKLIFTRRIYSFHEITDPCVITRQVRMECQQLIRQQFSFFLKDYNIHEKRKNWYSLMPVLSQGFCQNEGDNTSKKRGVCSVWFWIQSFRSLKLVAYQGQYHIHRLLDTRCFKYDATIKSSKLVVFFFFCFFLVLLQINLCRLFNAKSIFMKIVLFQTVHFSIITQFEFKYTVHF